MNEKELKKEYDQLVDGIESARMYDGRVSFLPEGCSATVHSF